MASEDPLSAAGLVTLLTDFGLKDGYVAALKAVILSRVPHVRIVDVAHEITPQAVLEAAFVLETIARLYPRGSVHVVVVDPGVGTSRRRLAIAADGQYFVGPDNGCLSAALPESVRGKRAAGAVISPRSVALSDGVVAVAIENESLMRNEVSTTFEGRDVFAPAAAHLACGGALTELGPRVDAAVAFPAFRAPPAANGLDGRVLHVDRYGNLITDIRREDLRAETVFIAGGKRLSLAQTYGLTSGLSAIVGSSGFVEIATPRGSAARTLGLGPGDRVTVSWP